MAEDLGFVEHVKDLLTVALGEVKVRSMFGGYGIYYGGDDVRAHRLGQTLFQGG